MAVDRKTRYTWDGREREITLGEALHDIASLGYAGFECTDNDTEVYRSDVDEFRRIVSRSGIEFAAAWSTLFPKKLDPSFRATIDPRLPMSDPKQYQPISITRISKDEMKQEIERQIDYAKLLSRMGAEVVTVGGPYIVRQDIRSEYYEILGETLNEMARTAVDLGLRVAYHPEVGTLVQQTDDVEKLFQHADQKLVNLCLETAHLTAAGEEPAAFVQRYGARIVHVHLKDLANGMFSPLGTGVVDFPAVIRALRLARYDGWLIAELDVTEDSPLESARSNKAFLDRLLEKVPQ
jgi:inosose dehydratase